MLELQKMIRSYGHIQLRAQLFFYYYFMSEVGREECL